ncbi:MULTISPECIES: gamma-glutamylcyclotransferase [unclassified Paracoccus (in: a-proteobacteria)]|uniref:gamma-glutamylcyclotransferase n=1 Tax=unclassified Paracoccus (in: a-proteobacteria) TaxID=2688777 RepID=UPI000225FC35|nr:MULTISPECIES: gamma-glutamylcyclotransferase [unclassified Paracoccus (in: a-proteobacteria)]SMG16382.1 cation transport protein ChaC [Paracoccus sp. J56]
MGERPEHWVFAYGSLMWDPGFPVAEMMPGRLEGYARSFCLLSVVYRGTVDVPGLVLGLDAEPGAHCRGLALRVAEPDWDETLAGLRARELTTNAYAELTLPLALDDGRRVEAVTYVIRRDHDQYAGVIDLQEQARIIARAHGGRGPNADYLFNTARHLEQMGIKDRAMEELVRNVRDLLQPRRE